MRIAMFTDVFPPSVNGVASSILLLSKELVKRGHYVKVFTSSIDKKNRLTKKKLEGIEVSYSTSLPSLFYPDVKLGVPFYPNTVYQLMKDDIDVVHFHTPLPMGADGIIAGKMLGKPIIGTFHTYFMEPEYLKVIGLNIMGDKVNNMLAKLGWKYANLYYNSADLVTTPTESTRKALVKYKIKRPTKTISNGIRVPHLSKEKLTKHHASNNLLYVGRLSREKNLDILIKAFKIVHDKKSELRLIVIGDGPAQNDLEELARTEGLEKFIHFKGKIPFEKLLESNTYIDAAMFVSASTSETQGLSIIEGMSYGLPVVAVAKRGIPELIKDNGLMSKTANAKDIAANILKIIENPVLAKKMSLASLKRADKYSIETVTTQFEHVYQKLIEQKRIADKKTENSFMKKVTKSMKSTVKGLLG
ncbi:MAG: glycosyltransferase [Candidatus Gracilibacteria bacterium]